MLQEQVEKDALAARKSGEKVRSALLVTVLAEISRVGKDAGNRKATDEEAVGVIKKFKDGVVDSLAVISDSNRRDALNLELEILQTYLPVGLTEDQLTASIKEIIGGLEDKSMKSIGAVMGSLKRLHGVSFDGATASRIIKANLV